MDHATWVNTALQKLENTGAEALAAVNYIRTRKVKIGFRKQGPATAAMWWIDGNLYLNPDTYSDTHDPGDAFMLSSIAHEAVHLQQGWLTALSRYGEFQAWQMGFRVLKALSPGMVTGVMEDILALPFGWDRGILDQAAALMVQFDPGYQIYRLPVYPLHREIWYCLTKRVPN
jgi:hypothetical protein